MSQATFTSDVAEKMDGLAPDTSERLLIPPPVFDRLPVVLREICEHFAPGFEKDVFLTAAIVVCSGILSSVKFRHRDKWYYLNLYALVTASAGSGKGDAGLAWNLAKLIDKRLYEASRKAVAEWEAERDEVEAIKARNKKRKKGENAEPVPELPPRPPIRTLRIAVNSSARAFIDRLNANGGDGLLFDTEIKTFNVARSQEWADTELYLKGFHNEPVNIDRADGVSLRIEEPRFAAFLTGTPEAATRLIPGAEDGLFSRIAHYRFEAPIQWRSQRPTNRDEARDLAIERGATVLDQLHEYLSQGQEPLFVHFTDEQWDRIDAVFGGTTDAMNTSGSNSLLFASVRRAALIAERIACILAVLRHFERDMLCNQKSITPEMIDVECGIDLAHTYLVHAIEIARTLPNPAEAMLKGSELRVFQCLSNIPITTDEIAQKLNITPRTAQRHIRKLLEYELASELTGKGPYIKANFTDLSDVASVASVVFAGQTDKTEPTETTDVLKATEATETTRDIFAPAF